jgi:hypothetical protein
MIGTLAALKTYISTSSDTTTDDATLTRLLAAAQRMLEGPSGLNRFLEPYVLTTYYTEDDLADGRLVVDGDLLDVVSLTNGDGVARSLTSHRLEPRNSDPKFYICPLTGYPWLFTTDGEIILVGIQGWHTRYSEAWVDSADTVEDNPLSASATTVTINSSRYFLPGQFLRCESEFMTVSEVRTGNPPTLIVTRGANGSTAVAHVQNTQLDIWTQAPDAVQMTLRLAAYLYHQRDASVFDTTAIPESGIIMLPKGIPADVKLWIAAHKRYV